MSTPIAGASVVVVVVGAAVVVVLVVLVLGARVLDAVAVLAVVSAGAWVLGELAERSSSIVVVSAAGLLVTSSTATSSDDEQPKSAIEQPKAKSQFFTRLEWRRLWVR